VRAALLGASVLTLALVAVPAAGRADSFTPIRMQVSIAPVARLHSPLRVTVKVDADAGVLDPRSGPLRARVNLADGECGGDFNHTHGVVLLDQDLRPQPDPGEAFQGGAGGSGRPALYGVHPVCVYLQDDFEQFATDTSLQVNVSRPCTLSAARYDGDARALRRARAALRRARSAPARARLARIITRARATALAQQRRGRAACGPGVPL